MFVRLKHLDYKNKRFSYLQIVKNFREGKKVKQQVIGNLGRLDYLLESGELDNLIQRLSDFSKTLSVIQHRDNAHLKAEWSKEWGSVLVFRRLWEKTELSNICKSLLKGRKYEFDIEVAVFTAVLQRLVEPGSDLAGSKWLDTVYDDGINELKLHHLYRAMDFLDDNKEQIERMLFFKDRDLFNYSLDLVFFDTTSIYFEGEGAENFTVYGHSKDNRSDRKQIIIGVVMTRDGYPLCCEFWPGNTSDVKTLSRIIKLIKERFAIGRVILVCDRGIVSRKNIESLEKSDIDYIVGVRMRREKKIREQILTRAGRYEDVADNLKVKEVSLDGKRYIVCLNPDEEKKDRQSREMIVKSLEEKLSKPDPKSLIANRGYKQFLTIEKNSIKINYQKIKDDARYDGKFVLFTNTELPTEKVAQSYKGLWQIESVFRNLKNILSTRPVFHYKAERIKGHIFCSFLSLYLMTYLKKSIESKGDKLPWDDIIRDIRSLKAVKITISGKNYLLRTEFQGYTDKVFKAVGIRPPATLKVLEQN